MHDATSLAQHSRSVTSHLASRLLFFLATVLIFCEIIISSRFYVLAFGAESRPIFMAAALAIIAVFIVLAALERELIAVLLSFTMVGIFVAYLWLFASKSGREINWNAMGQTYGLLAFIVFYELSKRQVLAKFLRLMLYMFTVYLLLYAIIASLHYADIIDIPEPPGVFTILHDRERGERLFLAGALATFVSAYSLSRLTRRFHLGYLFAFLVALAASALSLSRVFIVINATIALMYIFTRKVRLISVIAFAVYLVVASYLLWGVLAPPFNPFDFGSVDTSTLYRKHEYDVMAALIRLEPVFGIGLYDTDLGLSSYVGRELFFPSDIGIVGIWLMFGFVGVILLGLIPAWICFFQRASTHRTDLGEADRTTLALLGCCLGLYASASMNMINGPDSMMFALILGHWLFNRVHGSSALRR